jgi:hypothetical protein
MAKSTTTEETVRPKVVEIDCSTGVETVRDMTDEEMAAQEAMRADFEAREAERLAVEEAAAEAKASATAKLAALGLTEEEIAALVK